MQKQISAMIFLLTSMQLSASEGNWSLFADLLIWHASEETSTIWSSVSTNLSSNTIEYAPQNINFHWRPGLRAGLTYEPENLWDSKIYWTYFSSHEIINNPMGNQIIGPEFFSSFYSLSAFSGVDLNWRLTMNMFDYAASHSFTIGNAITLQPSIGFKAGTIHQFIDVDWKSLLLLGTEKVKHNYSGFGPTFGINAQWHLFRCLKLVGDLTTAFMWGIWNVEDTYTTPGGLLGFIPPEMITTNMDNAKMGTLVLDYFMGLEWYYHGRSNITFQLGYEMQIWPNQFRLTAFEQLPVHGDLTLQGGTCRILIDL